MPSRYSFNFTNPNTNTSWSCPIRCSRCSFVRANGVRCRNRVCFGSPQCWIHNSARYGVKAAPSTIQGAGKGLFATRNFAIHDWICPMVGENLTAACVNTRYPGDLTAPYVDQDVDENGVVHNVDCACTRGIGSFANALFTANGNVRARSRHNAISSYRTAGDGVPGIWLKADKAIQQGAEIFLWYGNGGYQLENTHTTRRRKTVPDTRPC